MKKFTILRIDGKFLSIDLKSFTNDLNKAFKTEDLKEAYQTKDKMADNCTVWSIVE